MFDITFAAIQVVNLALIDVDAYHFKADGVVAQHQGQANITEPDNADHGGFIVECVDGFL